MDLREALATMDGLDPAVVEANEFLDPLCRRKSVESVEWSLVLTKTLGGGSRSEGEEPFGLIPPLSYEVDSGGFSAPHTLPDHRRSSQCPPLPLLNEYVLLAGSAPSSIDMDVSLLRLCGVAGGGMVCLLSMRERQRRSWKMANITTRPPRMPRTIAAAMGKLEEEEVDVDAGAASCPPAGIVCEESARTLPPLRRNLVSKLAAAASTGGCWAEFEREAAGKDGGESLYRAKSIGARNQNTSKRHR
jgi:hypothetical protein